MKRLPSREELDALNTFNEEIGDLEADYMARGCGIKTIYLPQGEVYITCLKTGKYRLVLENETGTHVIAGMPWPKKLAIWEALKSEGSLFK